jgi:hypothetical protein
MNVHKNARLTPIGRIHLIELIDSAGLKAAAAATGLSSRAAAKWRDREACEGVAGLVDHSSRPRHLRAPITEAKRERIVRLRQRRRTMRTIAPNSDASHSHAMRLRLASEFAPSDGPTHHPANALQLSLVVSSSRTGQVQSSLPYLVDSVVSQ